MDKGNSKKEFSHSSKQYKYLGILTALYITFALISQITAGKISQIWIFTVSAATVFFPVTYILADVFTEVYGYSKARARTWTLLLCSVIAALLFALVAWLPPAVGFDANDAYVRVFAQIPRIVVASWIAIFFGSISNDYVLAKMKVWTKGRHLWSRTIGSTIVGEGVDSILFFTIAFYAVLPTNLIITTIISGWVIKVLIETVMTPITYKVVSKLKKAEGEDYYDTNTDFNPLIFRN
jgi:uncharacterized integral membrane protein (TIGR00697 family)